MEDEENPLKKKKSIIIYESMIEATQGLSDRSIAELWRAFPKYINGEEIAFETSEAKLAWNFIILQLNADKKKWDEIRRQRAEAGRKGNLIRWGTSQKVANVANAKTLSQKSQKVANVAVNVNVDVNKKEKSVKEKSKCYGEPNLTQKGETFKGQPKGGVKGSPKGQPKGHSERHSNFKAPTVEELEAYGKAHNFTATNYIDFWEFYENKGWKIGSVKMKSWQLALNRWERNQGKFDAKARNSNSSPKLTAERFRTLYRYKHRSTLNLDFSEDKERMQTLLSFDDARILQTNAYKEICEDLQNPFSEVSRYDKKLNNE